MTKTVPLPTGESVPALGLGTWQMGDVASKADAEVAAIRHAIDTGWRLFDTAEMYGEGGAETVLGRAIADALRANAVKREELVVVSKVYPHHASRREVPLACARSRKRLGLDRIDIYLLHWQSDVPIEETVDAFEALKADGAITHWGVSNFDLDDVRELEGIATPKHRVACTTNQVYYALDERGIEFSLVPYQRSLRMPTMAYCPLGGGKLVRDKTLAAIGAARGATAAQVALAWLLTRPDVIAIPKAADKKHLDDNLAAAEIVLTAEELKAIDHAFPPPTKKTALAMV
jgi:diketogulonate reductase-like aldo/keto reductase